jgi:hypothetical protein
MLTILQEVAASGSTFSGADHSHATAIEIHHVNLITEMAFACGLKYKFRPVKGEISLGIFTPESELTQIPKMDF